MGRTKTARDALLRVSGEIAAGKYQSASGGVDVHTVWTDLHPSGADWGNGDYAREVGAVFGAWQQAAGVRYQGGLSEFAHRHYGRRPDDLAADLRKAADLVPDGSDDA
jgi:hypothetical protein